MPLPGTVLWLILHLCMALGVNYFLKELNLIGHGEFISLYFIVLAGKYRDYQTKFTKAYAEDPDLVEAIMREDLNNE
jgi:hypothetical protein